MSEVSAHAPGTFCWIELGTTDLEAAKRFYGAVFGWTATDAAYSKQLLRGKEVAALYELPEEAKARDAKPEWLSFVSVSSADESAKRAKSLGGALIKEPFDVYESGRMALLRDPTGAVLALWEPRDDIGSEIVGEPGAVGWTELITGDVEAATRFYTELFGWGADVQRKGPEMEDVPGPDEYTVFMNGERPAAGLVERQKEWDSLPVHWRVWLAVDDSDAAIETARALGASILQPAEDTPGVGRGATLEDPQGAVLSIIQLAQPT